MKWLPFLFSFSLLWGSASIAAPQGARFEPYIGFKSAAFSNKADMGGVGIDLEGPFSGGLTGFRFGGRFSSSLGLGIEYAYGYLDEQNDRLITKDAGFYIEHQFSIPLRTWLTYYFSSEAQSEQYGQAGSSAGRGTKFGIGYGGFKSVSLNVEYLTLKYETLGPRAAPLSALGSILLSVSSPLDI